MRILLAATLLLAPAAAACAACCLSTSAFGAGRLAAWEDAAAGIQLGYASNGGRFGDDGTFAGNRDYEEREARATAFAIIRLARDWEAGVRVPWVFGARASGDHQLRAGPGAEVLFGGGVELGAGVVFSLVPRLRWHADTTRDGFRAPASSSLEITVGPSLAWDFSEHWTLQLGADTGLPLDGLGRNRPLLSAASVGFRRGFF